MYHALFKYVGYERLAHCLYQSTRPTPASIAAKQEALID